MGILAYKKGGKTGKVIFGLKIITLPFITEKEELEIPCLRNSSYCQSRAARNKDISANYLKELKSKIFNCIRSKITGFTESYPSDKGGK